jgi:hypothetical protein
MGKVYPDEITRILYYPGGPVGKECRATALAIAEEAKRSAIVTYGHHPGDKPRTGRLANSYQVRVIPGTNQFLVRNPRKYAAAMEFGARPHVIRARKVQYLRFTGRDGRHRVVKMVRHPGSKAHNTLHNAAAIVMRRRFRVG